MAGSFLHLELDNSGIKALIVDQNYKLALIKGDCRVRFEDLPDSDKNPDPFGAGMDRVAQLLDLRACSTAVIFVSPLLVSFRTIDLPFGSEKKMKQVLPFELETLLPGVNENHISDFHMLDIEKDSNWVLSASIAESRVKNYVTTLERFNIKPRIIAPGGYAAAVEFLKTHKDTSPFVFLHVADSGTALVLVNNQKPCVVRTFPPSLISPEALAESVKQTIMGFNQKTGIDISFDVFVSSDEASAETERIYTALKKIPGHTSGPGSQKKIKSDALLLNISPDRSVKYLFNFCRGKYGSGSFVKTYSSNIAAGVILFLFLLGMVMVNAGFDNTKLNKKIAAIDEEAFSIFTASFPDKKKILDPYLQMKANVSAAMKKSGTAVGKNSLSKNKNVKIVGIMRELSQKIDPAIDMEISSFLYNKGRLVLSGSTDNFNAVDTIKNRLESSDFFTNVSISSAAADSKGNRVNFKFIIEM
ncbi:PilN domain-containing protein [Desulfobacula sp.]|uniref:PilN domain-containing protein n=1 Tax=Desulfobacula sp. TaxID=2593537 RepID=UPI0025BA4D37|nr:PilN domain-containing protein [Desulfobacula sp.]MBC2704557.1 PilN domain-containing protein [Desulfobacula sp.]